MKNTDNLTVENLDGEIWKDIEGYEGHYKISSFGRVYSIKSGILLKQQNKKGYLVSCLCKNGKFKYIPTHRLVALNFIPNPENLPHVNHKDENKQNNCVSNLEWCTVEYNINYGTRTERATKSNTDSGHFKKLAKDLKEAGFFEERTRKLRENGKYKEMSDNLRKLLSKKIKCIETGKVYDSMISASRDLNIPQGSISNCCNGKRKSAHGYHFEYFYEDIN